IDVRARILVPHVLAAAEAMPDSVDPYLQALENWDYRMNRTSRAALVFEWCYTYFREFTWRDDFEAAGLDESYWPREWILLNLPEDSEFFGGDRSEVLANAMARAVEKIESEGWQTYGDYNQTTIDHQFGSIVPALNYPRYPTDGSAFTVFNFRKESAVGSSWRMISPIGGEGIGIIPGGNDGSYFSEHYADQLRAWANGAYKPFTSIPAQPPAISFHEVNE
ncbi:MAG: penicillin acylase family protein, partial [Halobacteriaceae archaeon]